MKRPLKICLLALTLCVTARAAEQTEPSTPMPPMPASPVQLFRVLLTTNAAGREQWLALRTPERRQYIEGKIKEYEALPAAEREQRLQTLQLHWYLPLLMKMKAPERARQMARLPEVDRTLLESKLRTWDILPPQLRQDILDSHLAISVFLPRENGIANDDVLRAMSPERRAELERQFQKLNELPADRRAQILAHFEKFFGLTPEEKVKALAKLTPADRVKMQQTLVTFDNLSPEQREQAMTGFKKFAELSAPERAAFLKSAERWQNMTEAEREHWRKIVARLQNARLMPPPPMPSSARRSPGISIATTNY